MCLIATGHPLDTIKVTTSQFAPKTNDNPTVYVFMVEGFGYSASCSLCIVAGTDYGHVQTGYLRLQLLYSIEGS